MTVRSRSALAPVLGAALATALAACADAPSIFRTAGPVADRLATLGWALTITSCVVVAVVAALVLTALLRHRPERGDEIVRSGPDSGVRWILVGGVVVPAIVLVAAFVFTLATQTAVAAPARRAAATVRIVGHRWWWEVTYVGTDSVNNTVTTANELHLPVGQPVQLELSSDDVIHSFWVPSLAGKTDLIPGQKNRMWIQADTAGSYWGQCAEYCGLQHAHMDLVVVAEPAPEFRRWLATQRESAHEPANADEAHGRTVFLGSPCAACHTIRGTGALGRVGPDLTHVGSRATLAAGALPNTRGDLAGWVANAQAIKPGSGMPSMSLAPTDLQLLVTYLESLR